MAFNSKHKICCLNFSWMTKQFFNISIAIFTRLTIGKGFFPTNINFENVLLDKKSNNEIAAHVQGVNAL